MTKNSPKLMKYTKLYPRCSENIRQNTKKQINNQKIRHTIFKLRKTKNRKL